MIFGYAYPAYECYKTVEQNKPNIEQLRFWCQYWILVAVLTVSERVFDTFVSWVPMYSEAKLAFYIFLWYPKTKGTLYVYDSFFRPYVAKHEPDIDRNLLELRTRAGDYAVHHWQRAASYSQTRIFEILQYVAAQSTPRPQPPQSSQAQQQATRARQPTAPPKPSTKTPPAGKVPPSPTSSDLSSEEVEVPESSTSQALKVAPSGLTSSLQRSISAPAPAESSNKSISNETDKMQIEKTSPPSSSSSFVNEKEKPVVPETMMEEAVRVTRGRLRKNRSVPSDK